MPGKLNNLVKLYKYYARVLVITHNYRAMGLWLKTGIKYPTSVQQKQLFHFKHWAGFISASFKQLPLSLAYFCRASLRVKNSVYHFDVSCAEGVPPPFKVVQHSVFLPHSMTDLSMWVVQWLGMVKKEKNSKQWEQRCVDGFWMWVCWALNRYCCGGQSLSNGISIMPVLIRSSTASL